MARIRKNLGRFVTTSAQNQCLTCTVNVLGVMHQRRIATYYELQLCFVGNLQVQLKVFGF